jgi:hypothetical protein
MAQREIRILFFDDQGEVSLFRVIRTRSEKKVKTTTVKLLNAAI